MSDSEEIWDAESSDSWQESDDAIAKEECDLYLEQAKELISIYNLVPFYGVYRAVRILGKILVISMEGETYLTDQDHLKKAIERWLPYERKPGANTNPDQFIFIKDDTWGGFVGCPESSFSSVDGSNFTVKDDAVTKFIRKLDDKGPILYLKAVLNKDVMDKNKSKTRIAYTRATQKLVESWDKLEDDEFGHILACCLGGGNEDWNCFPQARGCNRRGIWLKHEMLIKSLLVKDNGQKIKEVILEFRHHYIGTSKRPTHSCIKGTIIWKDQPTPFVYRFQVLNTVDTTPQSSSVAKSPKKVSNSLIDVLTFPLKLGLDNVVVVETLGIKAGTSLITKGGAKMAGTAAAKVVQVGSVMPVLGVAVGVGHGVFRLCNNKFSWRNLIKAGGEAASGIISTVVPGVGTAASVAINAAILADDLFLERRERNNS